MYLARIASWLPLSLMLCASPALSQSAPNAAPEAAAPAQGVPACAEVPGEDAMVSLCAPPSLAEEPRATEVEPPDANGRAIGVLGTGVDVCYPQENKKLYEKVLERGAIISEFPLGTHPAPENFPVRNRIVAGMPAGRGGSRGRAV